MGKKPISVNELIEVTTGLASIYPLSVFFATDNSHFFIREVDAKFTFIVDKDGNATGLILDQGDVHLEGKRVK